VCVPLALAPLERLDGNEAATSLHGAARAWEGLVATVVVLSLGQSAPKFVVAGAAAWLVWSIVLGLTAVRPALARRRALDAPLACAVAARIYLVVGAIWLLLAAVRWNPFGFAEPIVTLTAVHFHFAGFAALAIVGAWGRRWLALAPRAPWRLTLVAAAAIVGPILVALGITYSHALEAIAVVDFAGSLLAFAALVAPSVPRLFATRAARACAWIALGSLALSMPLALAYGLGAYLGATPPSLRLMAGVHGVVNALGFAACGLAAARLAHRDDLAARAASRAAA
jgi:hypothetical protein